MSSNDMKKKKKKKKKINLILKKSEDNYKDRMDIRQKTD